ncbi:hypothetical protein C8R45DRAFT_1087908 [Mycena sanguinolenta]|nr:hypothetical protein C8R45DRAFT_1087908 [Mycena sanguinolenta]
MPQATSATTVAATPPFSSPAEGHGAHDQGEAQPAQAGICPVPDCGSAFTRSLDPKGRIRSHDAETPFLTLVQAAWMREELCAPARLQAARVTSSCIGIISRLRATSVISSLQITRMDALNKYLRSEDSAECQRTLEVNGRLPQFSRAGTGLIPDAGVRGVHRRIAREATPARQIRQR